MQVKQKKPGKVERHPVAWIYEVVLSSGSYSPPFIEKRVTMNYAEARGRKEIPLFRLNAE